MQSSLSCNQKSDFWRFLAWDVQALTLRHRRSAVVSPERLGISFWVQASVYLPLTWHGIQIDPKWLFWVQFFWYEDCFNQLFNPWGHSPKSTHWKPWSSHDGITSASQHWKQQRSEPPKGKTLVSKGSDCRGCFLRSSPARQALLTWWTWSSTDARC